MKLFGHVGWRALGERSATDATAPAATYRLQGPHVETADDVSVALEGNPFSDAPGRDHPARSLAEAYRRHGVGCLERLSGRFAVAIVDRPKRTVVLALDPMGIERLGYAVTGDAVVFSSSLDEIVAVDGVDASLNDQALYDYLLLHMVPSPATVYTGVRKLRPGTYAVFDNGSVTVERFWKPKFGAGGEAVSSLEAQLLPTLRNAVASCAPNERTGAFLSGGLDSSSVSGMLGEVLQSPARTFSIGFGVEAFNELEYARVAQRHFRFDAHEYDVTPDDIVDAFPSLAMAFDEPFGNSSAVPTYYCARLAASHGIDHLLAGDGGDEIFGGNERYARQKVFEAYLALPAVLRRHVIEPLVSSIDPEHRVTPLRKARSYVDQARVPLPERLETWNFIYRTDVAALLTPEFRAGIDVRAPLRGMTDVYAEARAEDLLNRMLYYDWHYTLADNDLRKVGTACELAGVAVSYPMLDSRMIDLSLQVPSTEKIRGTDLRTFYKRAMASFLPAEIIAKRKHGFGLPFGTWLKTHARLAEMVSGYLDGFKRRGIVRAEFIDGLLAGHREGHASFYGYPIWDLAMLQAWLDAHAHSRDKKRRSS